MALREHGPNVDFENFMPTKKVFLHKMVEKGPKRILTSKGLGQSRFPLRKMGIGSDSFPSFIIHTTEPKKLKILQLFIIDRITGSNWNKKLVPKAHTRVQFCSDPVLSHAYFPEWKPAFKSYFGLGQVLIVDTAYLHLIKNTDKKSFA